MAKRIFIIHGWSGSPYKDWIPWLKSELESKGYEVYAPEMPDPDEPDMAEWVHLLKVGVGKPDKDTFFVGHSMGCQTILRFLETLDGDDKIGGVVLVAPWVHLNTASYDDETDRVVAAPWLETPIQWDKILKHAARFSAIFSDNDPYVPIADSKIFANELHADVVIEHDKGHMNEESGVTKLERILSEVLKVVE